MARPAADIEADIAIVNAALGELRQGNRVTKLELGSGEFARVYNFAEISFEKLKEDLNDLYAELASVQTPQDRLSFRESSHVQLIVSKFPRLS